MGMVGGFVMRMEGGEGIGTWIDILKKTNKLKKETVLYYLIRTQVQHQHTVSLRLSLSVRDCFKTTKKIM